MEQIPQNIKICIIGATGAVGREIVKAAHSNPQIDKITLIIRRKLPEWENMTKIKYILAENFDDLDQFCQNEEL